MLASPNILVSEFDPSMDMGINTKTLRAIFKILGIEYFADDDSFACALPWRVRICDQHDNEKEPHYILDVESGTLGVNSCHDYSVRYCDYRSTESGIIAKNPGHWYIHIWLPKILANHVDDVAKEISGAYAKAMEEELPDYEILYQETPTKVE